MTAREKFQIGDTVQMTERGLSSCSHPEGTGVVRGFGREADLVRIQRTGRKTIWTYHMDFWEVRAPLRSRPTNLRGQLVGFLVDGRPTWGEVITRTRGTRWLVEESKNGQRHVLDERDFREP